MKLGTEWIVLRYEQWNANSIENTREKLQKKKNPLLGAIPTKITLNPLDLATRITGDLFQWKDGG